MKYKQVLILLFIAIQVATVSMAADCTVKLSWDGKDSTGKAEQSLPVTFEIRDADTLDILTSGQVNGAVKDYALPAFGYQAPDNQDVTLRIDAVAKDSKGNTSEPSTTVSAVIHGKDTIGPVQPQITININQ